MRNTTPHLAKNSSEKNVRFGIAAHSNASLTTLLYGASEVTSSGAPEVNSRLDAIGTVQLALLREDWISSGNRQGHSDRTLGEKRNYSDKLLWFANDQQLQHIGARELNAFFDHLRDGHKEPEGRFKGRDHDPRALKELRPITRQTYWTYLKGLFSWLQKRGHITQHPFDHVERPEAQSDQITPFTFDQIRALLRAAKHSSCPHRNEALILFLLDTGARASEVCGLRLGDVDFSDEQVLHVRVKGKGNKHRTLRLSPAASAAMWRYFKNEHGLERFYKNRSANRRRDIDTTTPLFISAHRAHVGSALTRDGLRILIGDLGRMAHIGAVRCSPHTFRHTFAITWLRQGGDIYSLKEMLGHSSLTIVQQYLAIAQADIEAAHSRFSPAQALLKER